jgi:hypothetical protein
MRAKKLLLQELKILRYMIKMEYLSKTLNLVENQAKPQFYILLKLITQFMESICLRVDLLIPEFFKKKHELLIKFDIEKENFQIMSGFPFKKLNDFEGYYLDNGLIISYMHGNRLYLMDQNERSVKNI